MDIRTDDLTKRSFLPPCSDTFSPERMTGGKQDLGFLEDGREKREALGAVCVFRDQRVLKQSVYTTTNAAAIITIACIIKTALYFNNIYLL